METSAENQRSNKTVEEEEELEVKSEPRTVIPVAEQEDDEHDSKERVLQKYFLQEWKTVKSLLDDIVLNGRVSELSTVYKIRSILDKYQEQGQLLEPYLESIICPMMFIIRSKMIDLGTSSDNILEVIKPLCIVVYSLVTVCGYKAVTKFFPHQVSDLELAASLLDKCHNGNSATSLRQESTGEMEAKCVVLLWLSILVLVPFDISTVDTSIADITNLPELEPAPLVLRIIGFCKDYLSTAGPMRTIAGLVLSRLLTRPDMPKAFISFIDWAHHAMTSIKEDVLHQFCLLGAVEALAAIFKAGSRKLLDDVIPVVWSDTSTLFNSTTAARSPLLRKYLMKLTQRIGLTTLPPRSPSWRYMGRTISIGKNVSASSIDIHQSNNNVNYNSANTAHTMESIEDEDMDVPEIIEEIIEKLLFGLKDMDTVVRWSAAKGIGRITSRLTSALAEEVLSSVLELFSPQQGDGSWHGGCLALAELARRGLLLPRSLPSVVPVIVKALHYDVRRGPHSVGSHVRDAAAYVCWAFGRAYSHTDMRSILEQFAPHLLAVACYDREVNCRRAAAAAFQENVGRQGNYPHGIEIVNTADYFSLSSRKNSYIHVAGSIAQFEGYLIPFVDDLLSKIAHWDKALRELAAEALSVLVKYDPEYFCSTVIQKIIPCTLSSDLCMRHGATLACGELVFALYDCKCALSSDRQKAVAGVVPAIEKARLYRGKGGEIMRAAVSRFIECISLSCIVLPEKIKRILLDTLNENLRHPNSQIQNAAVKALKHFVQAYLAADDKVKSEVTLKYLQMLTDKNIAMRRGSALALGVLPYDFLASRWSNVLLKLCECCAVEGNPEDRDAEARVNAVKGLVSVCETLTSLTDNSGLHCEEDNSMFLMIKNEVMTSLLKALDDYSVDNRGDVGSWVREASLDGLERCTYLLCKKKSIISSGKSKTAYSSMEQSTSEKDKNDEMQLLLDTSLATCLIGGICKQAVEKMDRLRETAASVLQRMLYNRVVYIPNVPLREKLQEIVPPDADLKSGVPSFSFPRFVQLLQFDCYSKHVLSGLVISVGGLQESLRKASLSALMDYLHGGKTEGSTETISREHKLSSDVLWVLQHYSRCDRVIGPTLKTIEILLSKKIFLYMEVHTPVFCAAVLDSLAVELKSSKDFSKLYSGIAILGYIASVSDPISSRSFSQLLTLLGHRYPKIRKASAEQVYLVILQNVNLMPEESIEKSLEIISETCWDGDLEMAKHQRTELSNMAGLKMGLPAKTEYSASKTHTNKKGATIDENESYSSLVESSGF